MDKKTKDDDVLYMDIDEFFKGQNIKTNMIEKSKKEERKNVIRNNEKTK